MIISYLNSIRFRKVDSNFPNFDNTLVVDEKFFNDSTFNYCQRWLTSDTVVVQAQSGSSTLPTAVATKSDNSTVNLTVTQVSAYDQDGDAVNDLFFFSFSVDMSLFTDETFVTVEQDGVTYKSEPFKGDSGLLDELQSGEALKLEYYNNDNAFNIDFSSGAGSITYTIYIESTLKDLGFGGEISEYDNQDEVEKLKETVQRLLTFRLELKPRYLAETIKLASSCDNFVINGVSYIRQEQPDISAIETSNLVDFSMTLVDKEYLGVNSNDIGFDCDTPSTEAEIMVKTEENASGSITFAVPAGYMVHTLRSQWVSGTSVSVKLGISVGGDELVYPREINSTDTDRTTSIHGDINRDSDQDIYATVSGGVANLDLQIIQNKEITS